MQRVGSVIRLVIVGVFVAAVAAITLSSSLPLDKVVVLLVAIVAGLLGIGGLARYQKQAALASLDTHRLYKPNEVLLLRVLGYAQLGAVAVALVMLAKSLFVKGWPHPGLLLLILVAGTLAYLRRMLQKRAGHWTSMRLRLIALTQRSVHAVILVDRNVGREPIRVEASYVRSERHNDHLRTEVLWRSPSLSIEPQHLSDHSEFHVQVEIPEHVPAEIEPNEWRWRRQWRLKVSVSAASALNFNFDFNVSPHAQRST